MMENIEQLANPLEEISPELFIYEQYDSSGPLIDTYDIAKYAIGWCDGGRLQVRPDSALIAIMLEFPDGQRIWFHWMPHALKALNNTRARIYNYEKQFKSSSEKRTDSAEGESSDNSSGT